MPNPRLDGADGAQSGRHAVNFGLALVVAASQINRIVVSRIAERAGLKVVAETPEKAADALAARLPGTVILDGGSDDRDCEALIECLAAHRRSADKGAAPFVILLSNRRPPDRLAKGDTIDVTVAKPITPDRLQPLIQSLMDRVRD